MSDIDSIIKEAADLSNDAAILSDRAVSLTEKVINLQDNNIINSNNIEKTSQEKVVLQEELPESNHKIVDPLVFSVTIFVLACFVGYYVVWKVTPALHTPLMSVTNAISSIIIVGAILAAGFAFIEHAQILGLFAIFIASINIFGGFIVTQRMLSMFKKKK